MSKYFYNIAFVTASIATALVAYVLLLQLRLLPAHFPTGVAGGSIEQLPPQPVAASIYLLGDAGDMHPQAERLLKTVLSQQSVPQLVIFMGDNIYPDGLPLPGSPHYAREFLKLERQLALIKKSGARALFMSGNHDWGDYKDSGYTRKNVERIRSQSAAVVQYLQDEKAFLPANACPGPVRRSFAGKSILTLDTQWLLFAREIKAFAPADCMITNKAVYGQLGEVFAADTPPVDLLVSHHPLLSYGRHGKETGLFCGQGLLCPGYIRMEHSIHRALEKAPPLICAGGHDHSLQVIRSRAPNRCSYYLVSGAMSNTTAVGHGEGLLYGQSRLGFMRIDFAAGYPPRLLVYTVTTGPGQPEFFLHLQRPVTTAAPPA